MFGYLCVYFLFVLNSCVKVLCVWWEFGWVLKYGVMLDWICDEMFVVV